MTEEEIQALQAERDALAASIAEKEEAQADLERRHGELKANFEQLRNSSKEEEGDAGNNQGEDEDAVAKALDAFRTEAATNLVQDELVRIGLSAEEQEKVKKELGTFVAKPNNLAEVRAQIKRAAKLADLSDPYDFTIHTGVATALGTAAGSGEVGKNQEGETETQRSYRQAFGISDEDLSTYGEKAAARRKRNQFRD